MLIPLTELKTGQSGVVAGIQGGHGLMSKCQAMGIRPGKKITKISSHFWRGPQTVKIDNMQIGIGFGMASRIMIEVK